MSNPVLTPEELLVGLINAANTKQWSPTELVFGSPSVVTGQLWDTTVVVAPAIGQPYTGTVAVHYTRVSLASIVGAESTDFDLDNQYATVADLIPLLTGRYHVRLTEDDVVLSNLPPADEDGIIAVTVQARTTSLIWRGALNITLTPVVAPIDTVITVTELNGLDLENLQTQ